MALTMKISDALELFVLQLHANGRSVHTRAQYERHVKMLIAALGDVDVAAVDHVAIARFLVSPAVRERRGGGPRRATSANGLRSSLRVFFAWVRDAGYAPRNAAALVKRARCGAVLGRILTPDEQTRLEAVLAGAAGADGERDRMMVALLLGCGLRVGSLVGLEAEDVCDGVIQVRRAKNDTPVRVFAPRALRPALDAYVAGRSGRLFPVTPRHLARRLRHWCCVAGIPPASPHALRRTFGTRLYRACGDVLVVQRGLGHRSLASTLAYVHGVEERLREVVGALAR